MKHMNYNAAENQPHKYARPVTLDEMNRMPGQEEYERRTRTSKVFSLGRGLYQAVMYPEAVHFRDKNSGKLEEIDNTLMPIQDSACGVYLTNRNNDELKVEFHGAQDAAMVLLRNEDDCYLGWKLDGAQDVQPKVVDFARPQESKRDRRRAVLAQLDGEVVYEDIFPDVNLNCAVQALRFKDSFTFKTPESVRKLSFLLFTPEMQTEKQADDSIQVTASDGRTAFLLPRPFLQSAEAEDEIGGVQVDMSATDEPFTWRVTYTPDEKWLQKAKFPVVLDPAVITKNHSSAMEDNFVSSKKADEVQSYGATGMTVSYNSGNWGTSRSFIKFLPSGLPEIDSSYYITKAIFNVKTKTAPTTKASVYLKEVLGDWNSQTITYNNAPALNDKTLDYQYMEANSTWYAYKDCLTVVTDNLSGKKLFYHFNDYGNCISVNDQLGYACFAKYTDSNPINHPETISKMQRSVVNFLNGHNMQTAGIWTNESLDGTGTYSYATDAHYMGTKSLKMVKTNQTGWMTARQDVTLPKGQAYTFSAFFQTLADTVAQLRVTYKNSDGDEVAVDSLPQCSKGEWERMSVSFSLPADSASDSATVRLMAGGGAGTVWFDCAQLEAGEVANRYNMLTNGDFTFNCGAHPTGWSKNSSNTSEDMVYADCTGSKPEGLSANTMRLYGTGRTKYAGIYQDIPISGSKGDVFVAGGWSLNFSKPRKGEDFRYNIRVAFLKAGTSSTRVNTSSIEWSEEWTDWQFAAGPVVAPCDYTSIRFNVDYERNINYAEFGGLFLHKEEFGQTYVYDSRGNVLSAKNAASLQDGATYDAFDNILTYFQPGRSAAVKTVMEWGESDEEKKKHLLRKSTSPLGTVSEYTYDDYGNQLTTKTSDGTAFMQTTTVYDEQGNHVKQQIDARGMAETRQTDDELDTLQSVTDARGQVLHYTYDRNRRVTKASTTADGREYTNTFAYTKDKLTQVKHNTSDNASEDVAYTLAYDAVGRLESVKVGTQTLVETAYQADGMTESVTYGNRGQVCYTYDDFKRIVGMRYDDDTDDRFQYTYGANGEVARVKDCARDVSVLSEYDAANRPRRKTVLEGDKHAYTGELVYDAYDNVKTFKEQVGENREKYTTTFTHDEENRPTLMTFGDNQTVTYTYDGLGRVSERSANAGGTAVTTAYTYLDGAYGSNSTTPLVRTMTQAGTELTYTYDETGNIAGISDGQQRITYVYDLLGQLIRVNDPYDTTAGTAGTTWVFAYDHGGNIQKKTAYAYTTGSVGAAVQCDTFAYTDTNWKDKLTALNGVDITYDEIGNPLSDGTWQYKWAQGRQLRGMQKSGEEVAFAYNADGLRVQKTATSTGTTKYVMHGRNLVHLIRGDENLHFFYDAQNKPAMAIYNGTAYAYLYNQQDDVVGMVDSEGQLVVKYQYDAWGRPISTGGALAETLGALNPFRYRGYIYDEETGLYYLRSRYYNPKLSRFINADDVEALGADGDINGYQLFNYCMNDPVNRRDEAGSWSLPNWAKVAIGAALIVGAAVVATVATGGVACFAYGAAIGAAKGAVSGAIGGAISGAIESRIATGSWDGALEAAIDGAADGFLGGAIGGFIVGGLTSPNCFVAGTPIQTENGAVPIEEIVPGQLVWAENPDTGECTLKRVVQLFRNEKYELVHVQVRGAKITTTAGHPFFVQGQGWIFAKDLKVGYQLKLLSGGTALVEAVEWEELSEPVTVYNFEVEEFHTYFVGIHGFLVHNLCVQKTVAGDHNGYSARVSVGGEANRHAPHAHIFYKAEKIASVDDMGNILVGKLDRAGKKFVKQNIVQIADGIHKYYK